MDEIASGIWRVDMYVLIDNRNGRHWAVLQFVDGERQIKIIH